MTVSTGGIVALVVLEALQLALMLALWLRRTEPMDSPQLERRIRGAGETP